MNKLFLLILFVPTLLSAQVYVPFISTTDSSDTWLDINSCTDFDCYNTYTSRYTIEGDTTIGGLQYAKIYSQTKHKQGADQSQWCTESTSYYKYYFGAMRENGKKVYVIPYYSMDSSEYVAYDFNLTVGDLMPSPDGNQGATPASRTINSIDSVQVFGSYRKCYLVNPGKYVIEGIGASTGLFNPIDFDQSYCDMRTLCYSEYTIPDFFTTNCDMDLSTIDLTLEKQPAQLVKIVDYLGRETEYKPNTPLIFIYSDGTAKRVMQLED